MSFFQKMKCSMIRFMQGRHGPDQLSTFTLFAGLFFSILASFTGVYLFSLFGTILYIYTLYRIFSRNHAKRSMQNQQYVRLSYSLKLRFSQWIKRLKNMREFKYFKCPQCKVLLRLRRGCGKKEITCPKCSHHFGQKA